jgi:RHS repeat-associated protein
VTSFGSLVPNRHASTDSYRYGFNGMEKDDEHKGEGNSYDYGARMYDPRTGRWMSTDALESKYPYLSSYSYASNNPILYLDFDGNDWIYSTFKKEGKTYIKLTFVGAILNSSGKDINMKKLIANQKKEFEKVFGQGNVITVFQVREIKSKDELKSNEHLIEIANPNTHIELKELNKDSNENSFVGGYSPIGGKYVVINGDLVNNDGSLYDKKAIIHEMGHTAGLIHPAQFTSIKRFSKSRFVNGDIFVIGVQKFELNINDESLSNFMNYTSVANRLKQLDNPGNDYTEYFNNNVGKATEGQVQQIINNIFNGHLNFDNIPKDDEKIKPKTKS